MFGGTSYNKLKTNLRLAVNRLKLLGKKKTELGLKARKEIADYIANGKEERARIRVEHIIREDYLVEAMELIEMYCDLLLARFGLIQQMKTVDEGLQEAISSLIWVAPRLQSDVAELKIIADQLSAKYGKVYAEASRDNSLGTVSEKLMHKLSVQAPPKILVERYMIEIAKSHDIPFDADTSALKSDEITNAEKLLINFESGLPMPVPLLPQPPLFLQETSSSTMDPVTEASSSTHFVSQNVYPSINNFVLPTPSYGDVVQPLYPPSSYLDRLPDLPSVPTNSIPKLNETVNPNTDKDNEVDFDSLTKRFEELKRKK